MITHPRRSCYAWGIIIERENNKLNAALIPEEGQSLDVGASLEAEAHLLEGGAEAGHTAEVEA